MIEEGIYSILWEHRAIPRDLKEGDVEEGPLQILHLSGDGWVCQSFSKHIFNSHVSQALCWILIVLLLWLHLNSLLLFPTVSLIGFLWFLCVCGNSPNKQSLSTMCLYASWSLSSKKRESRELIWWFYYNHLVEAARGPSHLFLWPLSKDERNPLCEGNTGSLSK